MIKPKSLLIMVPAVLISGGVTLFLSGTVKLHGMPDGSMSPAVSPGESVLATRCFRPESVGRGEVVMFDTADAHPKLIHSILVSRVVAVAGDTVEVIDGHLHVNGDPLPARDGKTPTPDEPDPDGLPALTYPIMVPPGEIFTLGDGSDSLDSRFFGTFPASAITHRVRQVILPLSRWRTLG